MPQNKTDQAREPCGGKQSGAPDPAAGRASSPARIAANRANAQKSTGPCSDAGRARSARNAYRHGLSITAAVDPAQQGPALEWAKAIAGPDAPPGRLQWALPIAYAQLDVLRARAARDLLQREFGALRQDGSEWNTDIKTVSGVGGSADPERGRIDVLTQALMKLHRYERRALSRRKRAIRDWDELHAGDRALRQAASDTVTDGEDIR